jgi:hypothetical protein
MKIVYRLHDGVIRTLFLDDMMHRAVIGCDPSCDIVLPYQAIAPKHAILVWAEGRVFAMQPEGVCVTNPLAVDGMRLGNERLEVYLGSELSLGGLVFAKACLPEEAEERLFAGDKAKGKRLPTSAKGKDICSNKPKQPSNLHDQPSHEPLVCIYGPPVQSPDAQADAEYQAQFRALQKVQNNVMLIYGPPSVLNDVRQKRDMAVGAVTRVSPNDHKDKS